MEVQVNDEIRKIDDRQKLGDLLGLLNVREVKGVAVALNNRVVPRTAWQDTELHQNDKILIIQATQGG